jgi:6-phosphogluconolactonase
MIVSASGDKPGIGDLRWHSFADSAEMQASAYRRIVNASAQAIQRRGRFLMVLAGGETPRAVYQLLRDADTDWSRWHLYFGDERCLPSEDAGRNSRMAADTWIDHVLVPPSQYHVVPAELGAATAAGAYAEILRGLDEFDLVLLGLGEDGHTASLFPHHDPGVGDKAPDVLAVYGAPKPPPQRVSLSAARLSRTRTVLFLVDGESKRHAVKLWRDGADIPARAIRPPAGVDVLLGAEL